MWADPCTDFIAAPVTAPKNASEGMACPVVWVGLTVPSCGKFFEKFSHGYPFGCSFLITKPMLCAEISKMTERHQKENVNDL